MTFAKNTAVAKFITVVLYIYSYFTVAVHIFRFLNIVWFKSTVTITFRFLEILSSLF